MGWTHLLSPLAPSNREKMTFHTSVLFHYDNVTSRYLHKQLKVTLKKKYLLLTLLEVQEVIVKVKI